MAQIIKPILEFRELIEGSEITISEAKPPKKVIKKFVHILKEVPDPRVEGMIEYPLYEILLLAFLAVLGNAANWKEMEIFGEMKYRWLQKFVPLKNGIPSHDTFRRVFSLLDSKAFEEATVLFLCENMFALRKALGAKKDSLRHICIDGKEQRGSARKKYGSEDTRNLQTLHVYDASNGICLASRPIEDKTNEIPVAQEYLRYCNLKETLVTFDAMHTQVQTIQLIAERGGQYLGALKGNQGVAFEEIGIYFSDEEKKKIREAGTHYYEFKEKAHSQIETRRFYLSTSIGWFEDRKKWAGLKGFICYEKTIYQLASEKTTKEIRYYITSLTDVDLCAQAVRSHWDVENRLHWHLDRVFEEDDNLTADKNTFNNWSILNKMVLSIMKLAQPLQPKGTSIRQLRKKFGWGLEQSLSTILNTFDNDTILEAVSKANVKK